ncbi:MAG: sugar kinase [Actinophytocola sp.]|uniref:sugar kinase n=1 Tax=Actinophytocola sp. TaxID=1872138 RepID=UPI003C739D5F
MPDVLCLGETMAMFVPAEPGPPAEVTTWHRTVGGAESNVACHVAALGLRPAWVSAVGDDAFGTAVVSTIASFGVDVSGVTVDPERPTGLYVKERDASGSPVRYYRRGSAASGMAPALLDGLVLDGVRVVHTSGITPALSDSCLALMRRLMGAPRTFTLSFDLNWRAPLWTGRDPSVLRELASAADIVFVGADEAKLVWDVEEPARIRALLPAPATLVVKQGAAGATLVEGDTELFQPALTVDVVEPVGAGDAFAAGFLWATLAGWSPRRRLRAGHLRAATALRTHHDVGPSLPDAYVYAMLDASEAEWAAAYVTGESS